MKTTIALIAAAVGLTASAAGTINLQGTNFRTDTLEHYYIGPGVTHTHLCLTNGGRRIDAYAVTMDKADASYSAVAKPRVEIGRDQCRTAEGISSMAARKTTAERQYIAGINGDFFITGSFAGQHEFGNAILGYPNMACVIDGKIAAPDMIDVTSRENALIWDDAGGMWIDATDLTYKILNNDGSVQVKAKAVNYPMHSNEVMIYNSYMGANTATAAGTREIALRLAEGACWSMNKSVKFIVDGSWSSAGSMAIPDGGVVISCGADYANEWIDGLKEGDIVKLKIILSLPAFEALKPNAEAVIGGDVRILNQGTVTTEAIRWINTPSAKYSRSLVGYSRDRNKLVFAAVDCAGLSSGTTYYESADLMAALGCYDALDFDGGGSTALWLRHAGFANTLRDGSERAVGNGLFITMDAPADNTVATIRFADHAKTLPLCGLYKPVIYGYNAAGQLVDTNVQGTTFDFDPAYADAADGGIITAAEGCFALKATYGNSTATIAVTVDGAYPAEAVAKSMVIDGSRPYAMPLQARVGDEYMAVAPQAYTWSSADEGVATVDSEGHIMAVANGNTTITAARANVAITFDVLVQTADAPMIPLEEPLDFAGWKDSRSGVAAGFTTATEGTASASVDFDITSTRSPKIGFSKTITLFGRPDAICFDFDATIAMSDMSIAVRTAANAVKTISLGTQETGSAKHEIKLAEYIDVDSPSTFPLTFNGITFYPKVGDDGNKHGTLRVSNFAAKYNYYVSSVANVSADGGLPERLPLIIAGSEISTPLAVDALEAYTTAGVLAARSAGTGLAVAPGIYIVRATIGGITLTAKAIVK